MVSRGLGLCRCILVCCRVYPGSDAGEDLGARVRQHNERGHNPETAEAILAGSFSGSTVRVPRSA
jgi:hypothetical protein